MLNNRTVGVVIMIAAVGLFGIMFAYTNVAETAIYEGHEIGPSGECIHTDGRSCPFVELNKLAATKYAAFFADLALFLFGLSIFAKKTQKEVSVQKAKTAAKELGAEEAKVIDILTTENGMIFQNELVERLQISKVKATRILDKLEAKGLIERRRRGMTNAVIFK